MELKRLTNILVTHSRTQNWGFTLRGNPITPEEIFSSNGLLPAMAKRADQIATLCFGYGIGVDLPKQEKTTLGYTVTLRPSATAFVLVLCIFDVLEEIAKNASKKNKIAMDELLYE